MSFFASVIVPSFKRPAALLELLGRLRAQEGASFEILVVEQSEDAAFHQQLRALGDERLRLITSPPRGLSTARNLGARDAKGEILIFIDDDDLPLGTHWVRDHLANYEDASCVAVAGRWASQDSPDPPPRFPHVIKRVAFTYNIFKEPRTFAKGSLRKDNLEFIPFSNASVRRELYERVGGLETTLEWGSEDTFAFKFARSKRPGEYFVFDPRPVMWRRLDVPGGLERRHSPSWATDELTRRVIYYHTVTARFFPWRFRMLYPIYLGRSLLQTEIWIWDPDNKHHSGIDRARAAVKAMASFPRVLRKYGRTDPPSLR